AEDGIRDATVTGVQTCALPIFAPSLITTVRTSRVCASRSKELNLPMSTAAHDIGAANCEPVCYVPRPFSSRLRVGPQTGTSKQEIGRASCREGGDTVVATDGMR